MSNPATLSDTSLAEIERELSKYPDDRRQSAVMAALRIAQEEHGWVSKEIMQLIADYLDIAPIHVYEVASFYSMYELKPVGQHKISVCTNISCQLCDCISVLDHLNSKLGIGPGGTTADGRITIKEVECLGACGGAPMMQVNKDYHELLTAEKIDHILEELE